MDVKANNATNSGTRGWHVEPCQVRLRDGTWVQLRPAEPSDLPLLATNFAKLTREDIHQRFFEYLSAFPEKGARQVTCAEPKRDLALVAVPFPAHLPSDEIYGLVQLARIGETDDAEYGIVVRHDWQGRGLGWAMSEGALREARRKGLAHIRAYVLPDNALMLYMLRELGFSIRTDPDDARVILAEFDVEPTALEPGFCVKVAPRDQG